MTARILDGKAIAAKVRAEVAGGVQSFVARHGRTPSLHVVLVGDDPASHVYVRSKEKSSNECGMRGNVHELPASSTEDEVVALVHQLNEDPHVDGILVQLPLPAHMHASRVLDQISPAKDVDGLHPVNVGLLASGRPALVACTPRGCMRMIAEAGYALAGKRAVVVGRSNLVGKPMAQLLLAADATVTIAHSRTAELAALCREADVLVAAVGRARMVRGDWVKEGALVLDVGMNRDEAGKLCGDVDFAEARERAAWISPVPGGVGLLTVASLLENTLRAAELRATP